MPSRPIMTQWWRDIVFLHWRIDPGLLVGLLPRGVRPDVHGGSAWLGLIPFRMVDAGVGRRGPVPYLGTFLETNVRVYSVDAQGRRGVVFSVWRPPGRQWCWRPGSDSVSPTGGPPCAL